MAVVGAPTLAGQPVTLVGQGQRRHSMVAMRDVAAYAVAVLERQRGENQTLAIGGPQPISWHDVVAAFEHELERQIPAHTVPLGQPVPGMQDFLVEMLTALEAYDSPIDSSALAADYGVRPTSLADVVHGVVASSGQHVG